MRTRIIALLPAVMWFGLQTGAAQSPDLQSATDRSLGIAASALPGLVLVDPQGPAQESRGIAGDWNGALDVQGQKLRLVLHLKKNADGKLTGTIDSLDQGANDIPLSSAEQTGDAVKLELAGIGAGYQGKLNADGTEITGEWKQGGGALPLVFKRAGDKAAADQKPKGLPATLAGFEDQATFFVVINEERLGSMQSTWKKDGSFENHAAISMAGQKAEATVRIVPDADGRWAKISIEAAVGTVTLTRQGNSVTRTFKDKTATWETREGVVIFENNSPALVSQALRMYDRGKGGVQKLPLLILPGTAVDLTLEAKETADHSIAGKDLTLTKFLYGLPGLDSFVWADSAGKIYLIEVPAQKAAFVREGYEALRKTEASETSLSAPKYEVVVDKSVAVPMRDGVKLVADIYRPQGLEKAPVILVRTPYKKEMAELQGRYYARRGYVYAVQDCRGRFGSGGVREPFVNESRDGYDTIEWLAGRPALL